MRESYEMEVGNPFLKIGMEVPTQYVEYLLTKQANITLSSDKSTWNEQIVSAFENQHSAIIEAGARPYVEHHFKDWADGCSVGAITVTVGTDMLLFPVIIRYDLLAPFDVAYSYRDTSWHYADRNYINTKTKSPNVFDGMKRIPETAFDQIDETDRWANIGMGENIDHEVYWTRTASLSAPELIDKVAFLLSYASDNEVKLAYSSDWLKNTLKKINDTVAKEDKPRQKVADAKLLPEMDYGFFDLMNIKKAGLDRYDIDLARRGYNPMLNIKVSSSGVRELFKRMNDKTAEKVLGLLDERSEQSITRVIGNANEDKVDALDPGNFVQGKPIHDYGTFHVTRSDNGKSDTGIVIPVIEWDGKDSGAALYLGEDVWSVQKTMHGLRASHNMMPPTGNLNPKRKGVFVYRKSGRAYATPPVEIKSIYSCSSGARIKAVDLGKLHTVNIIVSTDANGIMPFGPEIQEYSGHYDPSSLNVIIPAKMTFTPLPEKTVKIASAKEDLNNFQQKIAETYGNSSGTLFHVASGFGFDVPGQNYMNLPIEYTEKAASDARVSAKAVPTHVSGAEYAEAAFLLKAAGVPFAESFLEKAEGSGHQRFSFPIMSIEKMAGLQDGVAKDVKYKRRRAIKSKIKVACEHISSKISPEGMFELAAATPYIAKFASQVIPAILDSAKVKTATFDTSELSSPEKSLNTLFNLGLLSDRNVKYMKSKSDLLDDAEDFFAKMLIAVRLTGMPVEESTLEATLEAISQTREAIYALGFGMEWSDF